MCGKSNNTSQEHKCLMIFSIVNCKTSHLSNESTKCSLSKFLIYTKKRKKYIKQKPSFCAKTVVKITIDCLFSFVRKPILVVGERRFICTFRHKNVVMACDYKILAEKQELLDKRYLRMSRIWAENSYCIRRKVGALLVKDKMIISDGYNGTPSGFENICEDETGKTKPYVLHAEANAITKIANSGNNSNGATLYVTASPCIECAKLIIQAGIKRVVYVDAYRVDDGIKLLERAGIEVVQLDIDEK